MFIFVELFFASELKNPVRPGRLTLALSVDSDRIPFPVRFRVHTIALAHSGVAFVPAAQRGNRLLRTSFGKRDLFTKRGPSANKRNRSAKRDPFAKRNPSAKLVPLPA